MSLRRRAPALAAAGGVQAGLSTAAAVGNPAGLTNHGTCDSCCDQMPILLTSTQPTPSIREMPDQKSVVN